MNNNSKPNTDKQDQNNNLNNSTIENKGLNKNLTNSTTEKNSIQHNVKDDWYYDAEIKGIGPVPSWFNKDKYRSIVEQAKAQRELESKLGQQIKAPKDYEINYPENTPPEWKFNQLEIENYIQQAKKLNLTNEQFNELIVNSKINEFTELNQIKQNEIVKLGPNANDRLENIQNWAVNNLSSKHWQALQDLCSTAEIVELIETFINRTTERNINSTITANNNLNQKSLQDRVSDPRYRTDINFRAETSRMFKQYYDISEDMM